MPITAGEQSMHPMGPRWEVLPWALNIHSDLRVLCSHNQNIKLLFFFSAVVECFPSQCRQIAVGRAIVFGSVTLGMYPTDVYCRALSKILSGLLFQTMQKHFILFCCI